ncbi:hypothetical protein OH76DRAFT_213468 [Lentinus brumalis]|uniref:Uncharacterized protein n=1 Tax=Lentinus brumalis TaxID=2498619 RepID=A0A371CMK4_9APHY|nr:hypothetical protein OH76DRAFT_213468 [Polyporus brumalis]
MSRPLCSHPRIFCALVSLCRRSARLALTALARPRLPRPWLSLRHAAARRASHRGACSLPSPSSALIAVRCVQLTGPGHDNVHGQQEATGKSMCLVQLAAMSPEPRASYSLSLQLALLVPRSCKCVCLAYQDTPIMSSCSSTSPSLAP